jgi:rubrerythrin
MKKDKIKTSKVTKNKTVKKTVSTVAIEFLSHFRCSKCDKWWSIGDAILEDRKDWFCPWCGVKNTFEKFNNK